MKPTGGEAVVPLREAWPLWMTAETAARYLDFSAECKCPREAFRQFARRHGLIPRGSVGGRPRWHRRDLDLAVTHIEGDRS